ncbi:hypothetical protein CgunFtcFv8_011377 [Champsocephalus gunnari]|uniref:Uncharacterized protein n=1 Tax=Champsocephalus gunnari TaxID=52237 RepID=A0AAN8HIC9_CHAGU|nr:hypothetical protein CgunFtcFv8_011377 [Champsocephalus gunnari]
MLQHALHGNLLRSFKLSADTIPQHGRHQRSPEPGQRRRSARCRRSRCRHCHSSAGEQTSTYTEKTVLWWANRTVRQGEDTAQTTTTDVGSAPPKFCFLTTMGCPLTPMHIEIHT